MLKFIRKTVAVSAVVAALASVFVFQGCSEDNPESENNLLHSGADDALLLSGHRALKNHDYDGALSYYEQAFQRDNNSADAVIYSTLAKLARISVDEKVVNLYKDRFGFTNYPNRLNALLSSDWLVNYSSENMVYSYYDGTGGKWAYWYDGMDGDVPGYYFEDYVYTLLSEEYTGSYYYYASGKFGYWYDESDVGYYPQITKPGYYSQEYVRTLASAEPRVEEAYLPELVAPNWVKGGRNSVYNSTLINGAPSIETYPVLLLANLLDRNASGFNGLLDEVIAGVFGASFNDACERIGRLESTKATITLHREFLDALNLNDLVDEYDRIGWAEVNALISYMTGVKASLQWLASYNWDTNLSFLKFAWTENEDDFYDALNRVGVSDLPFGNDFLKARPGNRMAESKESFVKAIEGLKASYSAILTSDLYPTEVKDAYPTLSQGADRLIAAIRNGGIFYIPEDPTRGNWPTSGNGIDMGKLFTPGYFSLQNLFETDGGKPVFYAELSANISDWELFRYDLKLTRNNYSLQLSDMLDLGVLNILFNVINVNIPVGGWLAQATDVPIGLKFKTEHAASVFVGARDVEDEVLYMFGPRLGTMLFEKFYDVRWIDSPLFKERPQPKQLAKARGRK